MKHVLLTVRGAVKDVDFVLDTLLQACDSCGAHVRRVAEHNFYPHGYSAVVILSESHASVHTWPEKSLAYVDYFSCAEDPQDEDFTDVWFKRGFALEEQKVIER